MYKKINRKRQTEMHKKINRNTQRDKQKCTKR